jgi:TonB-dependent SusC/RagA subfamily outer membrane receptor
MTIMRQTIALIAFVLLPSSLGAQTRVIHGKLTAFNTYPVQNIEVTSKKGKSSTVTDSLGQFHIVCLEEDVIRIKPKAFKPVSRRVGPETDSLVVNLVFINTRKNRDIAVGYGYVKESDLTYAISNLQQENNEFCHYPDIYELIVGRFAGVVVENREVIIRGRNSFYGPTEALYVVDGVVVNSIDWVTPCEVRSINVLKDASASTYGSRGANGVVIIETKR